jgi:hypothetical protein
LTAAGSETITIGRSKPRKRTLKALPISLRLRAMKASGR